MKNKDVREEFEKVLNGLSVEVWSGNDINILYSWIEKHTQEAYLEGYKKCVTDEIECVETSGEHLDLQKKLSHQVKDGEKKGGQHIIR